jgi:rubrerythrin
MSEVPKQLMDLFTELESVELQAARLYKSLLKYITDDKDKSVVNGIILDEERHAKLARECQAVLTGTITPED